MYRCNDCEKIFSEQVDIECPDSVEHLCPFCGSDNWVGLKEEDDLKDKDK